MPYKPKCPCKHPGCPELVDAGESYCPRHRPVHMGDRPGSSARGYGYRWQKASKAYLREHPLCVECLKHGRYTQATVVDHIIPHRGNRGLFWDTDNWQSLCKRCHDRKTGSEDSLPTYGYNF